MPVLRNGKRVMPQESLLTMQERFKKDLVRLPEALKTLDQGQVYPVKFSQVLQNLADEGSLILTQTTTYPTHTPTNSTT